MKTTMKHLTAGTFIAFLLLVGNVNAEGTEVKASSQENIETTLNVEKWMIDEVIWNTNSITLTEINQETETNLVIENWMTSPETWNFDNNFVEETEGSMELENWMTSEETWKVNNMNVETELTVETWMIDNNVWN